MNLSRPGPAPSLSAPQHMEGSQFRWNIVIADPDRPLPRPLLAGIGPQRLMVIQPEAPSEQDALSAGTLDLLADTVIRRDVEAIVVFGKSQDSSEFSQAIHVAQHHCTGGFSSMLRRMSARMEFMRRAQNRVRVQLNQIRMDARIADAAISRGISLCGLFHITESNAFLWYDDGDDRFISLIDTNRSFRQVRWRAPGPVD